MKPDICIYHSPCADGFAAAWAVWKSVKTQVEAARDAGREYLAAAKAGGRT